MLVLDIAGEVLGFKINDNNLIKKYSRFISKKYPSEIIDVRNYKNLKCIRFDNFLRKYLVLKGMEKGFLLVHSSAVIYKKRGYLFCGRTGTGKSRLRRFFKDGFSDELNIVRERFLYPSPFYSEVEPTIFRRIEIFKICFLKTGKKNSIFQLGDGEFFKEFLKNIFLPFRTERFDVIFKIWDNIKDIGAFRVELIRGFNKEELIELLEGSS